ncbi:hypothetical protein KSS87_010165 [Heliosperma pusillum]|nr:hypothetical protein KSS87_010165 [Heliosperma pusillum]
MAESKVKYDRQLRIWGDQGQAALEKASICLLNCGPTGSETLKNLVLGGIGSITVVDGTKVEVGDLGNNFMGIGRLYSAIHFLFSATSGSFNNRFPKVSGCSPF